MPDEFDGDPADAARPPFSPTMELVALARTAEVRLAGLLEPHGLTVRSYRILSRIVATPGMSVSDLARRSRDSGDAVRVLLRRLTEAGLVVSPRGTDQVNATAAGSDLAARIGQAIADVDAEIFGGDGGAELAAALAFSAATRRSG